MMCSPSEIIAGNIQTVRARMDAAAARAGRDPGAVTLLGVSKYQQIPVVRAALESGLRCIGENYVQELCAKHDELAADYPDVDWHFIGHLQRNKVRHLIGRVSRIHSVDRLRLLEEINRRAGAADVVMQVMLEVNLGGEAGKSGCAEGDVGALALAAHQMDAVELTGLMIIPPFLSPEEVRPYFVQLVRLREQLLDREPQLAGALKGLSMGMSSDFEEAIEEGATLVRVGTSLFGARG